MDFEIQYVGKIKTALFGGEGLFFAKMTGPGTVWLQDPQLFRQLYGGASGSWGYDGQAIRFGPGTRPRLHTRLRLAESTRLRVIAYTGQGVFTLLRPIKVIAGGCGNED